MTGVTSPSLHTDTLCLRHRQGYWTTKKQGERKLEGKFLVSFTELSSVIVVLQNVSHALFAFIKLSIKKNLFQFVISEQYNYFYKKNSKQMLKKLCLINMKFHTNLVTIFKQFIT